MTKKKDKKITRHLSLRDLAIALAALRVIQDDDGYVRISNMNQMSEEVGVPDEDEIDELCVRLNLGDEPEEWFIVDHSHSDTVLRGPYASSAIAGAVRTEMEMNKPDKTWNLHVKRGGK